MQVFVPYPEPLKCAETLWNDKRRFNKAIIEAEQILAAIDGRKSAWKNHPVVKMYKNHRLWLVDYENCLIFFELWKKGEADSYHMNHFNESANLYRPEFLDEEFCNQHKRRLYTKNPKIYFQFKEYGISYENWYFVDGRLLRYINGKLLNK